MIPNKPRSDMSSALRQAARRLGGGGVLQRSIAQEGRRRRLPTRLLHTPTPTTTRATAAVDDANAAVSRYAQIQEKEELYDLVEHFERTYKAPMRMSWRNSQLLHRLSTQVEPRPGDPYWRMCRRAQRKNSFFTAVGICSAGLSSRAAIAYGLHWLKKSCYAKELEDWWNKQMNPTGAK